jgi:hypothetical protein
LEADNAEEGSLSGKLDPEEEVLGCNSADGELSEDRGSFPVIFAGLEVAFGELDPTSATKESPESDKLVGVLSEPLKSLSNVKGVVSFADFPDSRVIVVFVIFPESRDIGIFLEFSDSRSIVLFVEFAESRGFVAFVAFPKSGWTVGLSELECVVLSVTASGVVVVEVSLWVVEGSLWVVDDDDWNSDVLDLVGEVGVAVAVVSIKALAVGEGEVWVGYADDWTSVLVL